MKYLRKLLAVLYIQVVCLPVFAVTAAIIPSWERNMWLSLGYTAICTLLGWTAEVLFTRKRVIWQMLLCVPLSAAFALLCPKDLPVWVPVIAAIYGIMIAIIANRMCAIPYENALNIVALIASFLVYVVAYVFLWFFDDTRTLVQTTPGRLLAITGVIWFVIAVIIRVRHAITAAAQVDHGHSVSSTVIRRNTLAGILFIAASFALGFSNRIAEAINGSILWIMRVLLSRILRSDPTPPPPPTPAPTRVNPNIDLSSGQDNTSQLGILIFNILMNIAITLVILVSLYFLGRLLYKIGPKIWRGLTGFLFRRDENQELVLSDYQDSSESLFSWANLRRRRENRRKNRRQYKDCADDTQRMRFLYRSLLARYQLRGQPIKKSLTPAELARLHPADGMEQLAENYGALRYGGIIPGGEDVENARRVLSNLSNR